MIEYNSKKKQKKQMHIVTKYINYISSLEKLSLMHCIQVYCKIIHKTTMPVVIIPFKTITFEAKLHDFQVSDTFRRR